MNRRRFISLVAKIGAVTSIGASQCQMRGSSGAHVSSDPLQLSATEAVAAMTTDALKAEELASAVIDRASRLSFLNAFISFDEAQLRKKAVIADEERARNKVRGPLHGLPIGIKDIVNTMSLPTTGGTPALTTSHSRVRNAELVNRLENAGAIIFSKTNMHELSFGATSVNAFTGAVGNPYNPKLIAGGSSGGSAAAVAAGIVPISVGGDTAGSIRIPASLCGICGLRPTVGSWPGDWRSVIPISNTRDTLGPMARSCADLELLHRVVTGAAAVGPAELRGLRLGVVSDFYLNLHPSVERVINTGLRTLEDAGVVLVRGKIRGLAESTARASFPIMLFEVLQNLPRYLETVATEMPTLVARIASSDVKALFESIIEEFGGNPVSISEYRNALAARNDLADAYSELFLRERLDALVFPTTVIPATPVDDPGSIGDYIRNTDPGSLVGLPGVTFPIGMGDGLPIGLSLDARPGDDRRLLSMGLAMERIFGRIPAPLIH